MQMPDLSSADAQALWKFLDGLAERDPAAYRAFQAKQKADYKRQLELRSPPQPVFSLECSCGTVKNLYINVCKSVRIQKPPESDSVSIPIAIGEKLRLDNDTVQVEVCVHPDVAKQAETEPGFMEDLSDLAIDCVKRTYFEKETISRRKVGKKFQGDEEHLWVFFPDTLKRDDPMRVFDELEKQAQEISEANPEDMEIKTRPDISETDALENKFKSPSDLLRHKTSDTGVSEAQKTKPLILDMENKDPNRVDIEITEGTASALVKFKFAGPVDANLCNLECCGQLLVLYYGVSEPLRKATCTLAKVPNEDEINATYIRKRHTLKVEVPYL
eukprot:Clim_evm100s128 gene=Clim_evmTU100s128